jgi:hypothetical protein
MEPIAEGSGLEPVAAVMTVFALVLGAICWLQLIRICFRQHMLLGLLAFLLPPLALLLLLPQWQKQKELFVLALAALSFISIAAIF